LIAVIDYGMGNVGSMVNMLKRPQTRPKGESLALETGDVVT